MDNRQTNEHDVKIMELKLEAAEKAATNEFDVQLQERKERLALALEEHKVRVRELELRFERKNRVIDSIRWISYAGIAATAYIVAAGYQHDVEIKKIEFGR